VKIFFPEYFKDRMSEQKTLEGWMEKIRKGTLLTEAEVKSLVEKVLKLFFLLYFNLGNRSFINRR
jgi:hypothetical protein